MATFNRAMWNEVRQVMKAAEVEQRDGVLTGLDDDRAAELGQLAELPTLAEVLGAWNSLRLSEQCEDYALDFRDLLMAPNGEFAPFAAQTDAARELLAYPGSHDGTAKTLPMTYRVFGNVLRDHCSPARNVARNLIMLPTNATGPQHTGRTMRAFMVSGGNLPALDDSPRAIAVNAMYDRRKRADEGVRRIDDSATTTLILRTRMLPYGLPVDGKPAPLRRTAIGSVTPTHCLRQGDDDKLIAALAMSFAGYLETARARAFRGVEESELRAIFPALEVEIPGTGSQKWTGYVTARNSESGKKSWAISAGLYRAEDGASVACEAVVRTGRHVGERVAERMVEVADGAQQLLKKLIDTAAQLAAKEWEGSTDELLKKLRVALSGTALANESGLCGIAWGIGEVLPDLKAPITIGLLMNVLGRAAGTLERRIDARPVEVMLGRMLVEGWTELKAVAIDGETAEEE